MVTSSKRAIWLIPPAVAGLAAFIGWYANRSPVAFDALEWDRKTRSKFYKYLCIRGIRLEMARDLIRNSKLKDLDLESIIQLLGNPDMTISEPDMIHGPRVGWSLGPSEPGDMLLVDFESGNIPVKIWIGQFRNL